MISLRFGLANGMIVVAIAAVACGGWPIWAAIILLYAVGGPLDEAVDDSADMFTPAQRWFCDGNLFLTLPLLLLLTFVYLGGLAGAPRLDRDIWHMPVPGWDRGLDLAAATFLLGSCCAMFGATVAHELTHRPGAIATLSAHGLLALMVNASFPIFHVHTHHRYVGTPRDPATARRGEHIVAFFFRTVAGQYADAFHHEAVRLAAGGGSAWSWRNRVLIGLLGSFIYLAAAALIAGWMGIVAVLATAIIGRVLHEFVNYIQHYGLVRVEGTPIAARHTWDSYRTLSNLMHYQLPRHADHHMFASKPYWQLAASPQAPQLPYGYMTMVLVALVPPLWRRAMAPRLAEWDGRLATDAERVAIQSRGWTGVC